MLYVLNGVQTVGNRFLEIQLYQSLNNFVVDGYKIKPDSKGFEIFDIDGQLVYNSNTTSLFINQDGTINTRGLEILEEAKIIHNATLQHNEYFASSFSEPLVDWNVLDANHLFRDNFRASFNKENASYSNLLERYNTRVYDVYVISGRFGKTFYDRIRQDLGSQNVRFINLMRNPSIATLLHCPSLQSRPIKQRQTGRIVESALISHTLYNFHQLKNLDGVTEVRFEDYLSNGKFSIEGKDVPLPDIFQNYNGLITQWEFENLSEEDRTIDLTNYNQYYQNYIFYIFPSNTDDFEHLALEKHDFQIRLTQDNLDKIKTVFPAISSDLSGVPNFPINLFESLDYQPSSTSQILA